MNDLWYVCYESVWKSQNNSAQNNHLTVWILGHCVCTYVHNRDGKSVLSVDQCLTLKTVQVLLHIIQAH